jgi:DNA primase
MFFIPSEVQKPVYLLYHLLENNIKTAYVVESQINALYMWSLGYPTVGLFGTGSEQQYETLRKCGIRNFITLFDGDTAGQKGAYRFRKNMPKDVFITNIMLPAGKDVNDLSPEEVHNLIKNS